MQTLKIELKEQLLIKCYVTKHLILLKIRNIMDIHVDLLQWSINLLIKSFCYACTFRDLTVGDLSYASYAK